MKRRTFVSLAGLLALEFPFSGSATVFSDTRATRNKPGPILKVVGIGGCGGKAVDHMIESKLDYVDFACADTDLLDLKKTQAPVQLLIGSNTTRGLGRLGDSEIGRQAALEDRSSIFELVRNTDVLFLVAGMGGSTGTGATPVFAEVALELGIPTVAVVTEPFAFECTRRESAARGIIELRKVVSQLIRIPNDKSVDVLDGGMGVNLCDTFRLTQIQITNVIANIAAGLNQP